MDSISNRPVASSDAASLQLSPHVNGKKSLHDVAAELEATFLSEMLRQAGLGDTPDSFGGGAGEDAFSSLMTREWARKLVEDGGIGLTEQLVTALQKREA